MNKALPYNIGLDISISGIGWCVTDSDGRILRHDKNHLWGTSLFQPANTAKERKQNRSTRRRLARKHARLMVLRSLLENDVLAADDSFYIRLDETSLDRADRTTDSLYSILPAALFTDGSEIVVDKSSGKQSLPIYKIRKLLCETDRQADIRYVYLAISHILKSRGHFQMDDKTQVVEAKADAVRYLQDAFETINDRYVLSVLTESEALETFCDELIDPQKTVDEVQKFAAASLAQKRQNRNVLCAVVSLLMGQKVKLNTVLLDAEDKDMSFAELEDHSVYDDLDEEQLEIILCLRDIYEWRMHRLAEEDHLSISEQMTMRYEQHRKDLRELKDWMRTYVAVDEYRSMFHSDMEDVNYNAYVQSRTDPDAYEERSWKSCSQDEFYLKLRKILSSCDDPEGEEKAQELISRMYDAHGVMIPNGFLPLQRIRYNSVLTNQAQTRDLMAILDKQSKYYATIRENRDRIIQLCEFHLPYYVGPLRQDEKSPFKPWIVYKAQGRGPVMPWDFAQRIDLDATAENYMKGLTNQCTFIPSEQVLPKHSLLYEEYMFLDELNRVRINGKLIKSELKKRSVIELFSRYRKVTDTLMTKWLRQQEEYAGVEEIEITSANGELKHKFDASLGSLIDMQRIFDRPFVMTDPMIPDLEKIIQWSTVFKDREIYCRKLDSEFGDRFTPQQMLELKARNYKEWGKLSEQLLNGIVLKTPDGDKTVISIMRDTNDNLMRVYHSRKYNMHEVLAQINAPEDDMEIRYDEVDEIPCSPALKRAIWQSVRIVRELTEFMGHEPGSIYLRNMRDDNSQRRREGNRKHSRYDKVRQLFDLYEKETGEKIGPSLRAELQKDKDEMSDVQYLYLTQMGMCMYSGRQIDLNDVGTYMMDSVVPLCLLPDDSIDNKVLILTEENRRGNKQAMPDSVIHLMTPYWTKLNRLGLISGRKLKKLQTRVYEENELRVYLSSQWTETSRIINKVTGLFKKHYTKTHVYGINARLTQHFRKEEKLFALRDLNDMHQAYEAFLTAHIGVFADKYLPKVTDEESYNRVILGVWERAGEGDKNGLIIAAYNCDQQDEHGESIWSGAEARKEYVRKVYDWHDYYVTNLPVIYQGKYFTETMYRPGDSIPAKEFRPAGKYGGFIRAETAYMAIIGYEKKDKKLKEVINVPAYVAARAAHEPSFLQGYIAGTLEFTEEKGYRNVRVIRDRIKLNQEILLDGHEFYLRSAHELVNARQLYMPHDDLRIIWNALTLPPDEIQNCVDNGSLSTEKLDQVLVHLMNKLEKEYPVYPKLLQQIREGRDQISRLQAYDKALLICALVMSMNNKGIRIQGYTKKMKEKILGTADNRIKNKKVCGEEILLVNRSVTGIRKQIVRV